MDKKRSCVKNAQIIHKYLLLNMASQCLLEFSTRHSHTISYSILALVQKELLKMLSEWVYLYYFRYLSNFIGV